MLLKIKERRTSSVLERLSNAVFGKEIAVGLKDVRAHCYCASLVRTLYMTWHVPRHVFQARAPSRNSIKYRAGDLCGNLICESFCWIIGDPHFFFRQITFFSDSFHYTKKQKNLYVRSFNYFLYTQREE